LLANLMPFILVPLNVIIFRRYPRKLFLYGLLCACVGLALLVGGKAEFTRKSITGDSLALLTAGFYALYLLITGTLRERYSTSSLVFWSALGCALFLLPLALILEGNLAITTTRGLLILLALAAVSQIGGQGLLAYSMGRIGINLSSAFVLLQPVIAAFYAYLLFHETFTWIELCGGLVILVGVYVAKIGCNR
jgi:drug/metabolite transporter (DMT)-like permease